jgi:hypothetical protein
MRPSNEKAIRFKVGYDGKPDKPIAASVYLFGPKGDFLASAPLEEDTAQLSVAPEQLKGAKLYVAPTLPKNRQEKPSLKTMAHLGAYDPAWSFEAGRELYELKPIPQALWPHWYLCSCRIRGRVIKVDVQGGTTYETPVCHARVHICEVDRIWWVLAKLPDPIIVRVRDELLKAIEHPIPGPPPEELKNPHLDRSLLHPPVAQISAAEILRSGAAKVEFNPQPDPPGLQRKIRTSPIDFVALNPQPLPPRKIPSMSTVELRKALTLPSASQVREALIKNAYLIWPYWCWWDWLTPYIWPFFYRCDPWAVVETDDDGRFDITVWYPCGDQPDLYFWIEYSVGGVWQTVYRPPIRCHTYWNYACGTDVTVRVTDPRVHGCSAPPVITGNKIVVKTIGREVSMGEIYRQADGAKEGQVKEGWINSIKPSPFGATLEPRVDFGTGLAPAITHYRWSYRRLDQADGPGWIIIDAPVSRHYRELTPPGDPVIYKSVQIAPDTSIAGSYYAIANPSLPPGGEKFEVLDEGYDLASAYLDTTVLAPTKYELKLELFHRVGAAMERINDLVAAGVEIDEVDDPAPLTGAGYTTVAASGDRLAKEGGTVVGYRLVIQVDNRSCFAAINDGTLSGHPAGQCGFLEYTDLSNPAHISFRASHPGNFASFSFYVTRVSTTVDEASVGGLVDSASVGGAFSTPPGGNNIFTRSGDTFSRDLSVNDLMTRGLASGETPCIRAAFAETLYVAALATNGYGRLTQYDAPFQIKAFAITPH